MLNRRLLIRDRRKRIPSTHHHQHYRRVRKQGLLYSDATTRLMTSTVLPTAVAELQLEHDGLQRDDEVHPESDGLN
jgi:hypothetical protein